MFHPAGTFDIQVLHRYIFIFNRIDAKFFFGELTA